MTCFPRQFIDKCIPIIYHTSTSRNKILRVVVLSIAAFFFSPEERHHVSWQEQCLLLEPIFFQNNFEITLLFQSISNVWFSSLLTSSLITECWTDNKVDVLKASESVLPGVYGGKKERLSLHSWVNLFSRDIERKWDNS